MLNNFSAFPNLWINYHVLSNLPFVPIMSLINPVHTLTICISNIRFDINLPLTSRSFTLPLSIRFSDYDTVM